MAAGWKKKSEWWRNETSGSSSSSCERRAFFWKIGNEKKSYECFTYDRCEKNN